MIERRGLTLLGIALTNLSDAGAVQLVLPFDRAPRPGHGRRPGARPVRFGRDHARGARRPRPGGVGAAASRLPDRSPRPFAPAGTRGERARAPRRRAARPRARSSATALRTRSRTSAGCGPARRRPRSRPPRRPRPAARRARVRARARSRRRRGHTMVSATRGSARSRCSERRPAARAISAWRGPARTAADTGIAWGAFAGGGEDRDRAGGPVGEHGVTLPATWQHALVSRGPIARAVLRQCGRQHAFPRGVHGRRTAAGMRGFAGRALGARWRDRRARSCGGCPRGARSARVHGRRQSAGYATPRARHSRWSRSIASAAASGRASSASAASRRSSIVTPRASRREATEPADGGALVAGRVPASQHEADPQRVVQGHLRQLARGGDHERLVAGLRERGGSARRDCRRWSCERMFAQRSDECNDDSQDSPHARPSGPE